MTDHPIQLTPYIGPLPVDLQPLALIRGSFAMLREGLAQPHYSHAHGFPEGFTDSRVVWTVRDAHTGSTLVVWDHRSEAQTPAETTVWRAWWQDGAGCPGSGRRMAEVLIGADAGGEVMRLPLG